MPRLLKLRVAALERIAHELRFAPAAAARRHTARAEKLAAIVVPAVVYPEDFVVFQITGFRPEIAQPELIPGDALLRDLAGLIDRLSRRAEFTREELGPPQWLTTDDLLKRWGLSRKSIERLRVRGLIGRRVALARGRAMNVFSLGVVKAVEAREGLAGGARSRPKKVAAAGEAKAAKKQTKPITARQRRLVERALRVGVSPRAVSKRLSTSKATVFRVQQRSIADRCRSVRLAVPAGAAELIAHEGDRFLSEPAAVSGLNAPGATTLAEHVADAVRSGWPDPLTERARAFAYWTLVERAQRAARLIDRTRPASLDVDRAVTDLRWAAALKAELVRAEQLLLLRTIEVQAGKPLLELPQTRARDLLVRCLGALCVAVDRFDPTAGRLAGVAGLELSRVVGRWNAEQAEQPTRAQPMGGARLDDWTRAVSPWQAWTNPPERLGEALLRVTAPQRNLLQARYGLTGEPPQDLRALAARFGKPARVIARLLHLAERAAAAPPAAPARGRKKRRAG